MTPCVKCGAADRYADGRCKPCRKENARKYYEVNREKAAKYQRGYREANKEKIAEYQREYREANKDGAAECQRKWREVNRERAAEHKRKWREANREKMSECHRKYRETNADKIKAGRHNRRAKIKGNGGRLSPDIVQTLMTLQKGKCACCGKRLSKGCHLDHIIPIALGGMNTDDNVQLLTPKCNLSKGAKHPVDYMRSKGRLI